MSELDVILQIGGGAVAVASLATNVIPTPVKPDRGSSDWRAWLLWFAYRALEVLALVGARAKARPAEAAAILQAVQDRDFAKVVDLAKIVGGATKSVS